MKTILKDRVLWFDGDSTFTEQELIKMLRTGIQMTPFMHIDNISEEVKTYNQLVDPPLTIKTENKPFDFSWNIPTKYKKIEIKKFLLNKFKEKNIGLSNKEKIKRLNRLEEELTLFQKRKLENFLRTIIYIKDTLPIYGIGRGSSVSSYLLFVIGIHSVDSVLYELDISDFFH